MNERRFLPEILHAALFFAVVVAVFHGKELLNGMSLWEYVGNDKSYYVAYYPAFVEQQRIYTEGYFPLWWSVVGVGLPMHGAWLWGLFFPNQVFFLPFDFLKIASLFLLNRIWLMGLTAYIFGRKSLSLSPSGAAMTGLSFAFTGFAADRLVMSEMNVPFLIPLIAYSMGEQVPRPRWGLVVLAGLAGAAGILSGHPPQAFYAFFFGCAWWFYRWATVGGWSKEGVVGIVAAISLSMLLSAIQFLPSVEVMATMWSHHPVNPMNEAYNPLGMFSMIMPWVAGRQENNQLTTTLMQYLGLLPALLFLFGLTRIKLIGKNGAFFAALAIWLTGVVYGLPIFRLWQYLPGFNRLANRMTAMSSVALCVASLAGISLDHALRNDETRARFLRFLMWMFPVLLLVAGYGYGLIGYFESDKMAKIWLGSGAALRHDWLLQTATAIGLLLIMALVVSFVRRSVLKRAFAAWLIVALSVFGLWMDRAGWLLQDPGAYKRIKESGAIAAITKAENVTTSKLTLWRVTATSDFLPPNLLLLPGFSDIRASCVFQSYRYLNLISRINGWDIERSKEDYKKFARVMVKFFFLPFPVEKIGIPLGNLLSARYGIAPPHSGPKTDMNLNLFYSGEDAIVYENTHAGPRAFVSSGYRVFGHAMDTLDFMINEPPGWERTALFAREDSPGSEPWKDVPSIANPAGTATCEVAIYLNQMMKFKVNAPEKSFLVQTELYFPGWKAMVNGKETRIFRSDYLLRAVVVPKGESALKIWYQPASFAIGLWVSISTMVFIVLIGIHRKFRKQIKVGPNLTV